MKRLTLFSWGYYGWGNWTPQFVKAVDAVEAERGFEPALFVDIRIRRSVRARGFKGSAFENLVGPNRHRWMKSLGNNQIVSRTGPKIQIADPSAANDLLDLAAESREENRRVIFFCSCQWPKWQGAIACHRATVSTLLLNAAKRRNMPIEVVEWPGEKSQRIHLEVNPRDYRVVGNGRMSIPLGKRIDLAKMAGLGWGSIATIHCADEAFHRIVGPVTWKTGQWCLPVLPCCDDPAMSLADYNEEASKDRKSFGLEPRAVKRQ